MAMMRVNHLGVWLLNWISSTENISVERLHAKKTTCSKTRIASFNRALLADKGNQTVGSGSSVSSSSSGQSTGAAGAMNYNGFLTLVTLDLIETIVLKFSRLGVHAFFGSGERYYQTCMLHDTTTAMFDEPIPTTTASENTNPSSNTNSPSSSVDIGPLAEYSSHLLTQLINVWFTQHPMRIYYRNPCCSAIYTQIARNQSWWRYY
ncbi:hypothetical protein N7488_007410 [Penicillium malachiteum]|nr:hypothetical protein N7488_007410 [Penicillium malachiteum]